MEDWFLLEVGKGHTRVSNQTHTRIPQRHKFEESIREDQHTSTIVQFYDKMSGQKPRVQKAARNKLWGDKAFRQRMTTLAKAAVEKEVHPQDIDLEAIGLKEFAGNCNCSRGQCVQCPCTKTRGFCTSACKCHPEKCQNTKLQVEEVKKLKVSTDWRQRLETQRHAQKQREQDHQQTETPEETEFFNQTTSPESNRTLAKASQVDQQQQHTQQWDRKKKTTVKSQTLKSQALKTKNLKTH